MSVNPVLWDLDARGVATVTFNRPEVNNAYDGGLIHGVLAAMDELGTKPSLRVVVLKGNGLLTVATEREREKTAQAYLNDYLGSRREERIHVVHRLDRETSGVLVFAKNFHARERLKEQFAAHTVDRLYVAIVEGAMLPDSGTIRSNLIERQ